MCIRDRSPPHQLLLAGTPHHISRSARPGTRIQMMNRILCLSVLAALTFSGGAAHAADTCTKIVSTGHPQYPAIAFKNGDSIVGAAPALVEAVAKDLDIPLES